MTLRKRGEHTNVPRVKEREDGGNRKDVVELRKSCHLDCPCLVEDPDGFVGNECWMTALSGGCRMHSIYQMVYPTQVSPSWYPKALQRHDKLATSNQYCWFSHVCLHVPNQASGSPEQMFRTDATACGTPWPLGNATHHWLLKLCWCGRDGP